MATDLDIIKRLDALEQQVEELRAAQANWLVATECSTREADSRDDLGAGTREDIDNTKLPRGKYAGKTHEWVVATDPGWVVWCVDNGKPIAEGFTPDEIAQARKLWTAVGSSQRR